MIIGINYNQDGSRSIARISYNRDLSREARQNYAHAMTQECDEVYVLSAFNFDNDDQDLINEIVTKGCRMV